MSRVLIAGRGSDNQAHEAVIDFVTKGQEIITTDHAAIHDGEGFHISARTASVADNGVAYVEFITPATGYIHLKQHYVSTTGASALFEVIEAPTLTTGETEITPLNRNRISTNESTVVAKSNPTGISEGTTIDSFDLGNGGIGSNAFGGNRNLDVEWVLKQDTTYLFKATNNSGGAANLTISLFWYEESAGTL